MMRRVLLLLLLQSSLINSLSIFSNYGTQSVKFGYILSFHVTNKGEMQCFYEELKPNSVIKATLSAVDSNQHEVHIRITSPSQQFSEWKHEINSVYFETTANEEGTYEFCATAKVTYGTVRLNLQLLTYLPSDIEKVAQERSDVVNSQQIVKDKINNLVTKIYRLVFYQRQRAETTIKDEMMQVSNGNYVYYFSLLQIMIIVTVGIVQTTVIRRLFNVDPKRIRI